MSLTAVFHALVQDLLSQITSPTSLFALCSAACAVVLVMVSSFVKTMIPLRYLAVGGNLGFLVYGVLHPSPIMALLHGALLPINVYRAKEMVKLTRRVTAAAEADDLSGVWLKP